MVISIIFVHYGANKERSELAIKSLQSIIDTTKNVPCQIILVDNGGDDQFFEFARDKKIQTYIRNSDNLWFGRARNQGVALSLGEYLAFSDNDILYQEGWIEECLEVLKETKGQKLLVTPLEVDRAHLQQKYFLRKEQICGQPMWINTFAGSNSWMMHREDFDEIGFFDDHVISGTKWGRRYATMGYGVAVIPKPKAGHLGLNGTPYAGYAKKKDVTIAQSLTNGENLHFYGIKK